MTTYQTYTKAKIDELINAKQNVLTSDNAGTGINITNGVISATGQVSGMVVKNQLIENTDFIRNGTTLTLNNYNFADVYIIRIGKLIQAQHLLSGIMTFCTFNSDTMYTELYDSYYNAWKVKIVYVSGTGYNITVLNEDSQTYLDFTDATIQGVKIYSLT